MADQDLLPCTCGLTPVVFHWSKSEVAGTQVRCPIGFGCGRTAYALTYVGARAVWNDDVRRARSVRAEAYAKGAG